MHVYYRDPEYFKQLSLFDDEQVVKKVMRVGGVESKLLDVQQFVIPGIGNYYGTTIKVQTATPLPVDTVSLTVMGSDVEAINDAEFYISSMYYKPETYYIYELVGVRLLPRI